MVVIKGHKLEVEKLYISDKGNMYYDRKKLYIQTPIIKILNDLNKYENNGKKSLSIDLSFGDLDVNKNIEVFYHNLENMDSLILESGIKNSKEWLNKQSVKDLIESCYKPLLRKSVDKKTNEPNGLFPTSMRVKINTSTKIYNFQDELIENKKLDDLFVKGCKVQTILGTYGVWNMNNKFGCSWYIEKIRIEQETEDSYHFINDSDSDSSDDSDSDG